VRAAGALGSAPQAERRYRRCDMVGTIVAAVVAVLALVGVVLLAVGLGRVRRGLGRRLAETSAELEGCTAARKEAERVATEARGQAAEAAARARASEQRAATVEGRERAAGQALWALERCRRAREWEGVAGPIGASAPEPGLGALSGLTNALRLELDIIREEVGTPGKLTGGLEEWRAGGAAGSPGGGAGPPAALLAGLLVVTELMHAFARRCESLEVSVGWGGSGVLVTLVGEDWLELGGVPTGLPGPDPALVDSLVNASRAVGSELRVEPVRAGTIRATWRLPLEATTPAAGHL
jgi:hypothetical protein